MARLSGSRGSIYLAGGSKLADSYLWEYEETQEVLDCSIKGENFRRYSADQGHGRVRVQSFISSGTATPLTAGLHSRQVTTAGVGTPVAFVLETVDQNISTGIIVSGSGYIIRSQLHVARDGILTDEMEIEVDGNLTAVN